MTTTKPKPEQLMLQGLEKIMIDMDIYTAEQQVASEYSPSPTKVVQTLRQQYQVLVDWYRQEDNDLTDQQLRALRFAMVAMIESLNKRGSYEYWEK